MPAFGKAGAMTKAKRRTPALPYRGTTFAPRHQLLGPGPDAQGDRHRAALVKAARASGVHHLVWSTLPDCDAISGGRFPVRHFSDKARVDPVVEAARFARHTFVQAPQYWARIHMRAGA